MMLYRGGFPWMFSSIGLWHKIRYRWTETAIDPRDYSGSRLITDRHGGFGVRLAKSS